MGKRMAVLSAALLVAALILVGCGNDDEPEPTATPTDIPVPVVATAVPAPAVTNTSPPPTATPEPAPEPTPVPDDSIESVEWERFEDGERGIAIEYPANWLVVEPSTDALTSLLAELGDTVNSEDLAGTFELLIQSPEQLENFVVLAFEIDEAMGEETSYLNNFTSLVVPSDGLTLDLYTALVSEQLSEVDGISVDSSAVVSDLRPGGLEAGSIEYTVDGALYGIDGLEVRGWQVALLSNAGDQLLVFTFGTRAEDVEGLRAIQRRIIERVQF